MLEPHTSEEQPINADPDQALMLQYARGNTRAFELLYSKHKGPLYRYFVRQIYDQQLAEDLYQETWSRVIKAASKYQAKAKFTTWLYRIAHNIIIDHVRAKKPESSFTDTFEAGQDSESIASCLSESPEQQLQQQKKALLLKDCVNDLPPVQQEAFLLNMEMGFTAATIADIAGATIEATKSRLRYANKGLKACVDLKWQEVGYD